MKYRDFDGAYDDRKYRKIKNYIEMTGNQARFVKRCGHHQTGT